MWKELFDKQSPYETRHQSIVNRLRPEFTSLLAYLAKTWDKYTDAVKSRADRDTGWDPPIFASEPGDEMAYSVARQMEVDGLVKQRLNVKNFMNWLLNHEGKTDYQQYLRQHKLIEWIHW